MSVHPDGTGTGWTNVEAVDVDQPHGKDYLYSQHIAKGVRKRIEQEHADFADNTVGGIHTPGGCAVLGIEDGTATVLADGTLKGHGIVWDNTEALWCTTAAAGASTTGDFTILQMNPNTQWKGGDVTWAGEHQFDASGYFTEPIEFSTVDLTGPLYVDSSIDCSDIYANGDISISGSMKIATDLTLTGDMAVDGTSNFTGDVKFGADISVDATAVFGAKVVIEGDASGSCFPASWGHADWTTNTLHRGLNVGSVDWTKVGVVCVSFSNNLASDNYAVMSFLSDYTGSAGADDIIKCVSQAVNGFRLLQTTGAGTYIDDVSEFNFVVFV